MSAYHGKRHRPGEITFAEYRKAREARLEAHEDGRRSGFAVGLLWGVLLGAGVACAGLALLDELGVHVVRGW